MFEKRSFNSLMRKIYNQHKSFTTSRIYNRPKAAYNRRKSKLQQDIDSQLLQLKHWTQN